MDYFLGIDGGGTRTTAWLADQRGKVLARVEAGPSNPVKVGFETAQREFLRATRAALRKAELGSGARSRPFLAAVCAGIAGVDRPSVRRPLLAWMRKSIPARHYLLTSDAAVALRAALGGSPGIIVIAGTGSIAFARDERGRLLRVGGWGIPFDDLGSGFDLGRKAVMAALQAFDGRGRETRLSRMLCRALRISDITQVIPKSLTQQQIAALFPLVMTAAGQGDRVAQRLSDEAARDLAHLAVALLRRADWLGRPIPVVCTGGVFRSSPFICQSFARHLRRQAPRVRVSLLRRQPVEGALALAREIAGGRPVRPEP
jgi:glucosamine kinase